MMLHRYSVINDGKLVCGIAPTGYLKDDEANARLIAAAPDLLAALIRLHEDWVTISGIDHGAGDEYADIRAIHQQCLDVIAKARGE